MSKVIGAGVARRSVIPVLTTTIATSRTVAEQSAAINAVIKPYQDEGLTRDVAQAIVNRTQTEFSGFNPAEFRKLREALQAAGLQPTVKIAPHSFTAAAEAAAAALAAANAAANDEATVAQLAEEMGVSADEVRVLLDAPGATV